MNRDRYIILNSVELVLDVHTSDIMPLNEDGQLMRHKRVKMIEADNNFWLQLDNSDVRKLVNHMHNLNNTAELILFKLNRHNDNYQYVKHTGL